MSLRGDLRTMALPDVLQWIASGRKTGTLHVERRSVQKRIILRDGNIFSSWSNDPRESLGQFLIRLRLVTEEQLFRALLGQEEKGRLLGSILVADGVLSEDDLRRALKAKAEETVYDLFLWPSGQFEFREGEFPEHPHHLRVAGDPGDPGGHPPGRRVAADPRRLPQPGDDLQGRAVRRPRGRTPSRSRSSPSPRPARASPR